jgi:protein phosphatase
MADNAMPLNIPDFCIVALVGVSGSGKSTFARRHFLPTEILSSDAFRGMVSDDENDQTATRDAFDALYTLAAIRLRRRKLVVVDATNVQAEARKQLLDLAAQHDCFAIALILDVPERVCQERNRERPDRQFGPHVVINQSRQLRQSLRNLKREGFRSVTILNPEEIEAAQLVRVPLWTDRRGEVGPFDIVGDVHGCYTELTELLTLLGYAPDSTSGVWSHPEGRRAVFVGDLVDRGPQVVETVELVRAMTEAGTAFCVPGNHDVKLMRALQGKKVTVAHGLAESLQQIEKLPEEARTAFQENTVRFIDSLVSHLWLDGGRLCVAHAGMKESYIGRASGRVRDFALYGDTTGETDEFDLPVRYPWAQDYRGATTVVYGHTPVPEADWLNNTLNLDTGCVFGGKLTALRWPEREIVQVSAHRTYVERVSEEPTNDRRPTTNDEGKSPIPNTENQKPKTKNQYPTPELLRAEDVLGKRIITTRLRNNITIPAENAAAALEVMSRYALDPRWLIYLPPTMSPCETAPDGDLLERPAEAFAYYRSQGVERVVCQRKHMGSRAVVIVCREEGAKGKSRFPTSDTLYPTPGISGQCYTRTGRQFFDEAMQAALLKETQKALTRAGFWEEFETDWVCLDCELMPWNAKAQALLREQYGPVGAAGAVSLAQSLQAVEAGIGRGLPLAELQERLQRRQADVTRYVAAYSQYCWPVRGPEDIRLAPFHLLATEGRTYFDRDHVWQMTTLARLAEQSTMLMPTEYRIVETGDEPSCTEGAAWWEALTAAGGEGMVVKPFDFIARGPKGLVQPAVKVRGREYLRIIYGPEYTEPENLRRLRARGLGAKRSLALREFALGVEALERFVQKEALYRVHACVFGVLALESEPVDPRL